MTYQINIHQQLLTGLFESGSHRFSVSQGLPPECVLLSVEKKGELVTLLFGSPPTPVYPSISARRGE